MFRSNLVGQLKSRVGRNLHAQPIYSEARICNFSFVGNKSKSQKTTVRADSSASRGSAEETVSDAMRVLISITSKPSIGDRLIFELTEYDIISVHPRRSVMGQLDHYECDIEVAK